ncbi:MAG: WD40 repeat domain-containing protein [Anaerolineae bacterium]|nr:WD40 repeat domain-containing protein [Anaerolineae bacterium]
MRNGCLVLFCVLILVHPVVAQDDAQRQIITADNAAQITRLAMLGRGWINQLAWSPDGSILAVASSAGVWLHDTADVDAPPRFLETGADTWSVVFSPDGRWLAAGGRDMSVQVWEMSAVSRDMAGALPVYELECRVGEWWRPVESLAFNPDGTVLACASDGVLLWGMGAGEEPALISGEPDFWGDTHVAFSPDGTTLATTGTSSKTATRKPGLVRQWDLQTQALLTSWQLTEGHSTGNYVAYSPDGTLLAVAGKQVEVRDAATGEVRYTLENTSSTRSLAFSPDGTVLATAAYDLAVWDVATGTLLARPAFDDQAFAHCFGEDTGQPWVPCPASYDALSVTFSPDGTTLAAADAAGRVGLWDIPSGERVVVLSGYNYGGAERGGASSDTISKGCFAFSPDGITLAAGASGYITSGGWVELWDIDQGVIQGYLQGYGSMEDLAYSPDGALLVTASSLSGLRLWDTATKTVQQVLMEYGEAVGSVAFSPDGTRLAAGLVYGEIHLWDVTTGSLLTVFEDHTEYMSSIAFSPDGILVAAGNTDGTIQIWDVNRGERLNTLEGHVGWVNDVDFYPPRLPDGRMVLASAGGFEDGTVRFWGIQPGDGSADELVVLLSGAPAGVSSVAFAPDSMVLASGHEDGTVRLWDALLGELLVTLEGQPRDLPVNVVFSPDGTLLATGGGDGTIRLWGVPR